MEIAQILETSRGNRLKKYFMINKGLAERVGVKPTIHDHGAESNAGWPPLGSECLPLRCKRTRLGATLPSASIRPSGTLGGREEMFACLRPS